MLLIIIGILLVVIIVLIVININASKPIVYQHQDFPKLDKRENLNEVGYAPLGPPVIPPIPGYIGNPVPAGALKDTNINYNRRIAYGQMPGSFVTSVDKYLPTVWTGGIDSLNIALPGASVRAPGASIAATNGIDRWGVSPLGTVPPIGGTIGGTPLPNPYGGAFLPNPIGNPVSPGGWEKVGIVQTKSGNGIIMNLYQRPIAPAQDLYEYQVEDRDGFIIPLREKRFLSDGDTINSIRGKENEGAWRVDIFENEKYIWI